MSRFFSKTFDSYKIRNEEKINYKSKIFIAYEGVKTEAKYFNMICEKNKDSLESKVEIFPIDRKKSDGKSHPTYVRDGLIEYYKDEIKDKFDKKSDSLWIVIDIDNHFEKGNYLSSKNNFLEYLESLNLKNGIKINIAISNPSFELWQILHYESPIDLNLEKLKLNKKVSKTKTYIKSHLSQLCNEDKEKRKISNYYKLTNVAIKNSEFKVLAQTNEETFDRVGTTVSDLFKVVFKNNKL